MNGLFWAEIGLITGAVSLFAYQRRLLLRPCPYISLQCGDCDDIYAVVRPDQVGAAVALHGEFTCSYAEHRYYG